MKKTALTDLPRTPLSHIPRPILGKMLTEKNKMSSKSRRRLMRARGSVIEYPGKTPKDVGVRTAMKLSTLPFQALRRRLWQSARRAATAKNLADKLSENSIFLPPLIQEQSSQLAIHTQVKAEIKSRYGTPA